MYTKLNGLSTNPVKLARISQEQAKARTRFASLSDIQRSVLGWLLSASASLKSVFHAQETIANALGICIKSVYRALQVLRDLCLVYWVNRDYQTCLYHIDPLLLSPDWHRELWYWFIRYPAMIVPIFFLSSSAMQSKENVSMCDCPTIISGEGLRSQKGSEDTPKTTELNPDMRTLSYTLQGRDPSPSKKEDIEVSDRFKTTHGESKGVTGHTASRYFNEEHGRKCRGIALALIKRGAPLTNDQALNLLSFNKDVLNLAIEEMKQSVEMVDATRYFLGLCRKFARQLGIPIDYELTYYCRAQGLRLLREDEEVSAMIRIPTNHAVGYQNRTAETVLKQQQAHQASKIKHCNATELYEAAKKELAMFEEHAKTNPFMASLVEAGRKWVVACEVDVMRETVGAGQVSQPVASSIAKSESASHQSDPLTGEWSDGQPIHDHE